MYATDHEGDKEPTIWLITKRDPATYETEFVSFVPGRLVVRLSVLITPLGTDQSSVAITYVRTGISEAGNAGIADAQRTGAFEIVMTEWEDALNYYLATGQRLKTGTRCE